MRRTRTTTSLPIRLALAMLCLAFVAHAWIYRDWIEDDTYITLRYADNLAHGLGPVFNAGETIEGFSNPLWMGIGALCLAAGWDPLAIWSWLGIACGAAAVWMSLRLVLAIRPGAGWAALLAPAYLAASPVLARHAVSGLETAAYAAALIGALLLGARERPGIAGRVGLIALLAALMLLRPEGVGFALLILGWRIRRNRDGARIDVLPFLALLIGALIARHLVYDAWLPNTFHFKMTGGGAALIDGLHLALDFLRVSGGGLLVGLALLPWLDRRHRAILPPVAILVGAQILLILASGGDWMQHFRFFAPILPLLAAMAAAGAAFLRDNIRGRPVLATVILAISLLASYTATYKHERAVWRLVGPALSADEYLTQGHARVGRWLRDNTPDDALVAASDIGAVGWVSGRPILDMFGLVDAHIARAPGRLHHKCDPRYVLERKPDIVVLVAGPDGYRRIPDHELARLADFAERYQRIHEIGIGFGNERAEIWISRPEKPAPTNQIAP